MTDYFEINRSSWNRRTPIHIGSEFYDLDGFKKGNTSLKEIEIEELGDVQGKSLLHLQCHFGMDTLSWARLGAEVTGVDISDESISYARELSKEIGVNAKFIRNNIYDLKNELDDKYDIVYTSYGAINWLDDLDKWADIINSFLKPGGQFYIVEFHPFIYTLGENKNYISESYFKESEACDLISTGTYTENTDDEEHRTLEWSHSISEVVNALLNVGFKLEFLNEFPYLVYNCYPNLEEIEKGKWVFKDIGGKIPYMFSLNATKG